MRARALVNAAGPWIEDVGQRLSNARATGGVRLVRGSHIVTRRLYAHEKCYFFQGADGRIIFAIPFEEDFTLIGTTEVEHADPDAPAACSEAEADYLRDRASRYFRRRIDRSDIAWTYSGVRPLQDDGAGSATAASRDYALTLDEEGAPLLAVHGGKITTYRKLAEDALAKLRGHFPEMGPNWTAEVHLPGGDMPIDGAPALARALREEYPFLDAGWARRLTRTYGTEARALLGDARTAEDLGGILALNISVRELEWAVTREWVRSAEDFAWRRTRLGLRLSERDIERLEGVIVGIRKRASS